MSDKIDIPAFTKCLYNALDTEVLRSVHDDGYPPNLFSKFLLKEGQSMGLGPSVALARINFKYKVGQAVHLKTEDDFNGQHGTVSIIRPFGFEILEECEKPPSERRLFNFSEIED